MLTIILFCILIGLASGACGYILGVRRERAQWLALTALMSQSIDSAESLLAAASALQPQSEQAAPSERVH